MLVSQATINNNPLPSLGESVSFGRFTSDSSLSWDKWSSFSSHNRYVEEAERYAQPGSVAQKKAFFEAHYKRIAAQKAAAAAAAAQLEHTNIAPEPEPEESHVNKDTHLLVNHKDSNTQFNTTELDKPTLVSVPVSNHEEAEEEEAEREVSPIRDIQPLDQIMEKNGISDEREQIEDSPTVSFEEKPLLKHKFSTSTKSSGSLKVAKVFSSPAKPAAITPSRRKENNNRNNVTPLIIKKNETTERRRWSPRSSLHSSKVFQYSSISTTPKPEPDNNKSKPITPANKIESSKVVPTSSAKAASSKVFKTPTRNYWTTPSKMGSSSKTAGTKHHPPATTTTTTPCSENSRSRTPAAPSVSGSKTSGPKWHLLSSVCSKSLSACKNKLQSPTLAVPFSLRTEERATRRKQNLEEKFNSKDAEKLQLQTRIKEKAETEFRKFRENFCFRARPLPEFYKDREIMKKTMIETNKVLLSLPPQSPKLMGTTRTGCMNMKKKKNQEKEDEEEARTTSVPPPRKMLPFSSTKNVAAAATRKGGWGHNRQVPTTSSRIICQNISPNIILQNHH
ncbi:protein WVD2-like 7 [Impatiens glandulifera]|uniref:protein WVD2-like 7 n=1 Tax=Impatiens glandulifera TaxID=253017 RepID=UPI001FB04FE9|nr:protein WVD2-like 7 [Impatiens glandulifera]